MLKPRKDNPDSYNFYLPEKYIKLIERQQIMFPLLKPSVILSNILDLYYEGVDVVWVPKKVSDEEEYNPKTYRGKKNSSK